MKLEGEIGEINLIERLVELGREQFTGAIRFENDGIIKIIYFKSGDILSASTNDRADSIDEILMRANKVSRDHVKQALAKRKESETLGDALLGLGFITKKELSWARRVQVIGVIRSIAAWSGGSYTIVADYLPKREEGTLFPLAQIITELIVTDTDRAKFDVALDGGNTTFTKAPDFDEAFRRLGLNQEAAAIMNNVDGTNNASEIAMLSGTDTFNVYKLLHALHVLGLLVSTQKPQVQHEDLPAPATGGMDFNFNTDAVSDAADMGWGDAGTAGTGLDFGTPEPIAGMPDPGSSFESGFDAAPQPAAAVTSEPEFAQEEDLPMGLPAFDTEPEPEPAEIVEPPATAAAMPSWDKPAAAPPPITPMQPFVEKAKRSTTTSQPKSEKEEQWGFDEAQIETARKAAVPVRGKDAPPMKPVVKKASKPGRLIPVLFVAVGIVIVGIGGLAGWNWWQNKKAAEAAPVVTKQPAKHPVIRPTPPPPTGTTATTTVATVVPTTTLPVAITTTAPAPHPSQVTTTQPPQQVAPVTSTVARVEKTPSGSVIPNTTTAKAAVPPATDADRQRYETMAKEFAADKSGTFTVQFELVCEAASITRALREGGSNVWFLPISYHNRSCYRVFWGRYATEQQAQAGANAIPQSLREAKPVVVHIPR